MLDHESTAAYSLSASTNAVVGVLPKQTCVLFVDADSVLYHYSGTVVRRISSVL